MSYAHCIAAAEGGFIQLELHNGLSMRVASSCLSMHMNMADRRTFMQALMPRQQPHPVQNYHEGG